MIRGRMRWHRDRPEAEAGRTAVHRDRPPRAQRDLQRPGMAAQHRAHVLAPGRGRDLPRRGGLAGLAHGRDRGPGDHRRDRRRGRLAAGRLAAPPRVPSRARGGAPAARHRRRRMSRVGADDRRRDHRRGVGRRRLTSPTPRTRSPAGSRTSASTRRRSTQAKDHVSSGASGAVSALLDGVVGGICRALVDRLLRRDDGAQPVLPAQGRAADPLLGRRPPRRPAAGRPDDHPAGARVAARLLPRGDDRRRVQRRRSSRSGRRDPRCAAGRDDHRGHLPRRLRAVPRRLDGGRVLGADRARRRRRRTPRSG